MRYYVDLRVGCVAVRDLELKEEWYSGLHSDDEDVVAFWNGVKMPLQASNTKVTTNDYTGWYVPDHIKLEAQKLCDTLNKV